MSYNTDLLGQAFEAQDWHKVQIVAQAIISNPRDRVELGNAAMAMAHDAKRCHSDEHERAWASLGLWLFGDDDAPSTETARRACSILTARGGLVGKAAAEKALTYM